VGILLSLAGPIAGALFAAIAGMIVTWLRSKADQQTGANQEAAAVTSQSLKTETAIAQAETDAPRSQAAVAASLASDQF
jgi:hypothetical protein